MAKPSEDAIDALHKSLLTTVQLPEAPGIQNAGLFVGLSSFATGIGRSFTRLNYGAKDAIGTAF